MNLRILLGSLAVVGLACSSQPPPIGGGDASTDGSGGDAATDAPADAATSDGGGGDGGGSCTLSSPPSSQACTTCLESTSSCCDRWNACAANADCTGYVACIRKCYPPDAGTTDAGMTGDGGLPPIGDGGEGGGFACAKNCDNTYPNGVNDGTAVVDCEDTTCAGLCN